ncbi:MAG: hypothetical protein EU548_01880 [Promethearchaeota archaeon]|nr:MAG: hypothetical protein EU548_01880 [Candidatus Lokiarchaeota archaeon]
MKIEVMNINFVMKKLQHISASEVKEVKMKNGKIQSMPPILAYIEEYAEQNGFEVLNGAGVGNNIQIFLIKK